MAEIPQSHFEAMATRLEESMRREVDRLRDELKDDLRGVHARVGQVNDTLAAQNGRVRKSEIAIAVLQWALGATGVVAAALFVEFLKRVWP